MKTPCQEAPELWVSDFVDARREAAAACDHCPAFDWCAREIIRIKPTHGIFAGKDYSKVDALANTTKARRRRRGESAPSKACEECGARFQRSYHSSTQWARARFCGRSCANAVNSRTGAAA